MPKFICQLLEQEGGYLTYICRSVGQIGNNYFISMTFEINELKAKHVARIFPLIFAANNLIPN